MAKEIQNEPTQEFLERKKLLELKRADREYAHEQKMIELKLLRANEKQKHEMAMERQRIKSAEIRKNMMRQGKF